MDYCLDQLLHRNGADIYVLDPLDKNYGKQLIGNKSGFCKGVNREGFS
jgi:hypothetical protein